MPRSLQWMDLYQIWFEGSSRGRNQLCRISWISILWGVKIRHLPLTWPVAQPVISNFCDFDACKPTFWSHNHEVWRETWDTFPAPKFVKIAQGDSFLRANFYLKFKIFTILSYLSPHFYSHNVKILLKRTDLGIHQRHKISSKSLKGPAGIALPRRWCILFVFLLCDFVFFCALGLFSSYFCNSGSHIIWTVRNTEILQLNICHGSYGSISGCISHWPK